MINLIGIAGSSGYSLRQNRKAVGRRLNFQTRNLEVYVDAAALVAQLQKEGRCVKKNRQMGGIHLTAG